MLVTSFINVSIDHFFKFQNAAKIICCVFNQSFLLPFDGKYLSATALLVYIDIILSNPQISNCALEHAIIFQTFEVLMIVLDLFVAEISKENKRKKITVNLLIFWRKRHLNFHATPTSGKVFYLRRRTVLGIIDFLGIDARFLPIIFFRIIFGTILKFNALLLFSQERLILKACSLFVF